MANISKTTSPISDSCLLYIILHICINEPITVTSLFKVYSALIAELSCTIIIGNPIPKKIIYTGTPPMMYGLQVYCSTLWSILLYDDCRPQCQNVKWDLNQRLWDWIKDNMFSQDLTLSFFSLFFLFFVTAMRLCVSSSWCLPMLWAYSWTVCRCKRRTTGVLHSCICHHWYRGYHDANRVPRLLWSLYGECTITWFGKKGGD